MASLDFDKRVETALDQIRSSPEISDHNRELVLDYHRDRSLKGLSPATHQKNLSYLKVLAEHVDEPFDEMEADDVKDIVAWMQGRDLAPSTIETYKEIIRLFFTWIHEDHLEKGETPDCVNWMEHNSKNKTGKLPQDLLTKEDIDAQVAAASNPRDKALIMLLWETGARIGELIDLTVGDIEDRKHGKKIVIDGKTGSRRIPLVESVPYLNSWLNDHPNPEKDAPLWYKLQQHGPSEHLNPHNVEDIEEVHGIGPAIAPRLQERGIETGQDLIEYTAAELSEIEGVKEAKAQRWLDQFDPEAELGEGVELEYRYIREKILDRTMEKAGIEKDSNPHHYRHSRASYLANHMTESQLCEWFGWVQGSDVPAKYVHLSGRDMDNAYDQMHGLYEPKDDDEGPDVVECPRCEELNRPDAKFCDRCGFALDQGTAEELEKAEEKTTETATVEDIQAALELIQNNPDKLEEFKEEHGS